LEENHRHEDEVRGGVGGAVTGFFDEGKFLGGVGHGKEDLTAESAEERRERRRRSKIIDGKIMGGKIITFAR
jgi:hypothetical protein